MIKCISTIQLSFLVYFCVLCGAAVAQHLSSDKKATRETVSLYRNLRKLINTGILFGHQDDLAYGVRLQYEKGRSDVKDVTGDYPAVYGWEPGRLELDQAVNLDGVPFDKMRLLIKQGYSRGGIITISCHLNNPLTGKTACDPAPRTVESILPGGEKNELYKAWLNKIAAYSKPAQLKSLYQFTVTYIRYKKKVHNLLYVFNTDHFSSGQEYLYWDGEMQE